LSDSAAKPQRISLIGLPGTGKSTAGRQVARQLNLSFIDTDHLIEQRVGCSISVYFEHQGEQAFRDVEAQVIDEVTQRNEPLVIATGGGVVLRVDNREHLRQRTTVLYLRASAEELARRMRHDQRRPLLQGGDVLTRMRQLLAQREPLYRQTAHYVIEAQRPSVHAMTNMVLMQLELAGVVKPSA
jgi:shikimate kinase